MFYQIPPKAHAYSLVFLYGAAESKKTWESTPDGREGFQTIFLRRGYGVYLLDQPRRGEAGKSTVGTTATPRPMNSSGSRSSGSVIIPIILMVFNFRRTRLR